jgi:regulator of sigma E protease
MTTILAFVFVLGVLVFVHELGHFVMAKKIGVRVLKFQLGFNPTVISFTRGGTEYGVGAIPLGGYVKMAGENPDEPRSGRDDEFLSKPKWQRFQVMIMGPAMNLALAIILMAIVFAQGADVPAFQDRPPVIGSVLAASAGEAAGLKPGDRVVSVADRDVDTWEDFFLIVGTKANRDIPITVLRDGAQKTFRVTPTPQTRFEFGDIGVLPDVHPFVADVFAGQPAEKAGIKPKDKVIAVDGQRVTFPRQLSEAISGKAGVPITVTIDRDGLRQDVKVTPQKTGDIGMIGIRIGEDVKRIQPTPVEAIKMSFQRNWEFAGLIFQTLWGLVTRETSPRQLMGPVAIAQLSGESAEAGFIALLTLMASISLNLGLLNLLPIPVLDGGHIFIMALEGLARRDFSTRVKEKMFLAGFVLLMLLMVTVIYNDLTRIQWIERLMPWR